jgi:hypothetical protein
MTDITTAEREIREALAAGPTPGPWEWWTSNSLRRLSSTPSGKDGDVLHAYRCRDGVADISVRQSDMDIIAACNPANIAAILAELDRLRAEAASWEQQAQDRTDDALKFAAERDALRDELNRLCPSSWDENARAWAEELRKK